MKKSSTFLDVLVDGVLIAAFIALSSIACFLISFFCTTVVGQISNNIPEPIIQSVKLAVYLVGINAILSVTAYKMGNYTVRGSVLATLGSVAIAAAIYFPVCLVLGFPELIAGAAEPISAMAMIPLSPLVGDAAPLLKLLIAGLALLLNIALHFAFFAFFRELGIKKRLDYRRSLERERAERKES